MSRSRLERQAALADFFRLGLALRPIRAFWAYLLKSHHSSLHTAASSPG